MRDALLETVHGFPEAPRDMFGPRNRIRSSVLPTPKPVPPPAAPVRVTPTPVPPTAKDPPITLADLQRKKPGSRMTTDRPKEMK